MKLFKTFNFLLALLTFAFLLLTFSLTFSSEAYATHATCASVPISGSYTLPVSTTCAFAGAVDGVDGSTLTTGTDTTNNANLTLSSTSTLQVGGPAGATDLTSQVVVWGGTISIPTGASITIRNGASLRQTTLWLPADTSSPTYPATTTMSTTCSTTSGCYSATQPPAGTYTFYRRYYMTSGGTVTNTSDMTADCSTVTANVYRTLSVAADADNDSYTTTTTTSSQCVGDASTINTRTYYKNSAGAFTWLGSASSVVDCNEAVAGTCANAITTVSATAASASQIDVSWTAPTVPAGSGTFLTYKFYNCSGTSCTPTTLIDAGFGATSHINGALTCATPYGYKVLATNSAGDSADSNIASATTSSCVSAPTVTTPTATSIGATSATLGANVTSNGGAALTARGTCWGTSASPTTNCLAEGGTATGVFSHSRTGMTASTLYYYRGYATNSVGTSYSADGTFTTTCSAVTQYADADGDGWDNGGTTTSQGANSAATAVSDKIIKGYYSESTTTVAWGGPSQAFASGGGSTTATSLLESSPPNRSEFLKLTNYGFTIPSTALITGIEVGVKRSATDVANNQVRDSFLSLVKNGIISGSNKALTTTNWKKWSLDAPTGDETKTYGSSTDTWGMGWKPADINATNFGVALAAQAAGSGATIDATVDWIWIKVYYKPTATPVSQCPTAGYSTGTSSGVDCDNASATNWRIRYPDVDADTYYSIAGGVCVGNQAGYADSSTDCLDSNANVKPGQTSYFTSSGGMMGGWDYNCDGTLEANAANYCTGTAVGDQFYDLSNCTSPIAGTTRFLGGPNVVAGNIGTKTCGKAVCDTKYYCSGQYTCDCAAAAHGTGATVGCR